MNIPGSFIFLILLLLFILTIVLCTPKEGFISFAKNENALVNVIIPQYSTSRSVLKLHDSMFFDKVNGNLIEVDSQVHNGNVDLGGNAISKITVAPRKGVNAIQYTVSTTPDVISTGSTTMEKAMQSKLYETLKQDNDKYSVIYTPWDYNSYLHIINNKEKKQIANFMINNNESRSYEYKSCKTNYDDSQLSNLTFIVEDTDENNNKEVDVPEYTNARKLYQLSKYIRFDKDNGNLVIFQGDGEERKMNVIKRNNTKSQTLVSSLNPLPAYNNETSLASIGYTPITAIDPCGQLLVVYVANGQESLITLISLRDVNTNQYDLKNVKRFNQSGLVSFDGSTATSADAVDSTADGGILKTSTGTTETTGVSSSGKGSIDMDDYLLKTQIVPPVCPSCPSCPKCEIDSQSICQNCGGQGGSGTMSNKGNTLVNNTDPKTDPLSSTVKVAGNVANTALDTTGDVATAAIDTAVDITGAAAKGVGELASPVVDAAGNVISGAGSAAKSGAEYVGGKVADLTSPTEVNEIGVTGGSTSGATVGSARASVGGAPSGGSVGGSVGGTRGQPANLDPRFDVYTRYGSLEEKKPSSYMPLTADFSAFSK